jgi:GNAT superfamily N-acetyltransferase
VNAEIAFRPVCTDDAGYIFETFGKSYRQVSAYAEHVPAKTLGSLMRPLLERWEATVAIDPGEPTSILGWIVHQGGLRRLAWLFTDPRVRNKGVARALLKNAGIKPGVVEMVFAPTRLRLDPKWIVRFRPYLGAS